MPPLPPSFRRGLPPPAVRSATSSQYFSPHRPPTAAAVAARYFSAADQSQSSPPTVGRAAPSLPDHARTIVVGGGIIGNSVAYHLSKKPGFIGEDILLLEQNQLTSGTTWHAAGLVGCLRGTSNETVLSKVGQSLYSTLFEETGCDPGYKNNGSITLARTPERMQALQLSEQRCRAFGVPGQLISGEEAVERLTHDGIQLISGEKLCGALDLPMDGVGSPTDLCLAFAAGAKQRGVLIAEHSRVSEFLTRPVRSGVSDCFLDGDFGKKQIVGVTVEQSGATIEKSTITCDNLILCSGQWSRQLAATINVNIPLHSAEHYYIITSGKFPGSHPNLPVIRDPDAYLYMREWSEGLCIGGFEPHATPIWTEKVPEDFQFGLLPDNWDSFDILLQGAMVGRVLSSWGYRMGDS